jgi:hypothetical protein
MNTLLCNWLFGRAHSRATTTTPVKLRLELESLDARVMPASITFNAGVVRINGGSLNDAGTVTQLPGEIVPQIKVTLKSTAPGASVGVTQTRVFQASEVLKVIFVGGTGNDRFENSTSEVANAYGGNGNDVLLGGSSSDYLQGDEGNDQLQGRSGNDTISGGVGNDVMFGENGNDIILGSIGNDYLSGGAGNDQLHGNDGATNCSVTPVWTCSMVVAATTSFRGVWTGFAIPSPAGWAPTSSSPR